MVTCAEADNRRDEQPGRGRQGEDPVADGGLEQPRGIPCVRRPLLGRRRPVSAVARRSCTHWSGVTVTERTQLSSSEIAATENSEAQYSPAFSVEAAIG